MFIKAKGGGRLPLEPKKFLAQTAYYHMGDAYLKINEKIFARNAFQGASKMSFDKTIEVFKTFCILYQLFTILKRRENFNNSPQLVYHNISPRESGSRVHGYTLQKVPQKRMFRYCSSTYTTSYPMQAYSIPLIDFRIPAACSENNC